MTWKTSTRPQPGWSAGHCCRADRPATDARLDAGDLAPDVGSDHLGRALGRFTGADVASRRRRRPGRRRDCDGRLGTGTDPQRCLRSRSGDAVDLEVVAALEVAYGRLRARPVPTVDGEVVAETDKGDLQLGDALARRISGGMLRVGPGSSAHNVGLNVIAV